MTARIESVERIGTALAGLANGQLNQHLDRPLLPELDQLRVDLNSAFASLQQTMRKTAPQLLQQLHSEAILPRGAVAGSKPVSSATSLHPCILLPHGKPPLLPPP